MKPTRLEHSHTTICCVPGWRPVLAGIGHLKRAEYEPNKRRRLDTEERIADEHGQDDIQAHRVEKPSLLWPALVGMHDEQEPEQQHPDERLGRYHVGDATVRRWNEVAIGQSQQIQKVI